jgi:hypothetical protein
VTKTIKNIDLIKDVLESGKAYYIDPDDEYRYTIYSSCPSCQLECAASRFERDGMNYVVMSGKITKVGFSCPACGNVFAVANPEELFLM